MKYTFAALLFLLAVPQYAAASLFTDDDKGPAPISANGASFESYFSPADSVEQQVVKEVLTCKKSIRVTSNLFASKPVSEALVKAVRTNNCDVKFVLDAKSNDTGYSNAPFLKLVVGSTPRLATKYDNLYINYIVIDESDIILGNIAKVPDANAEAKNPVGVLIIHSAPELAKKYLANWQTLWDGGEDMKDKKK